MRCRRVRVRVVAKDGKKVVCKYLDGCPSIVCGSDTQTERRTDGSKVNRELITLTLTNYQYIMSTIILYVAQHSPLNTIWHVVTV